MTKPTIWVSDQVQHKRARIVRSRLKALNLACRKQRDRAICGEKGADQLCSYCTADLRLWFRICRLLVFYAVVQIVFTSCPIVVDKEISVSAYL